MSDFVKRLEDELVRAGYNRSPWRRLRRSRVGSGAISAACLLLVVGVGSLGVTMASDRTESGGFHAGSLRPRHASRVTVTPVVGRPDTAFRVAMTAHRATGVKGHTRTSYVADAHAVQPKSACVNNRDVAFPRSAAGTTVAVRLSPLGGEGGNLGWCRGRFRGTVTYIADYACPSTGACHPPHGFPRRHVIVARFTFRVR